MYKYTKLIICSILLLPFSVFAWDKYYVPQEKKVIITDEFEFTAEVEDNKIFLEWDELDDIDDNFMYYKIMADRNNSNPTYPKNNAVWVLDKEDETEFVFNWPKEWSAYYRVCMVSSLNIVYCSENVEKINFSRENNKKHYYNKKDKNEDKKYNKEENNIKKDEDKDDLPDEIALKLDKALENFFKKLDSKVKGNEKKIAYLEKIVISFESKVDKNPRLEPVVDYLVDGIEDKIEDYEENISDSELDSILSELDI